MNYRNAHIISLLMTFLGIAFDLSLILSENYNSAFMYLGLVFIVAGLIIRIVFCRCPKCRRGLRTLNFFLPDYCPHCGEKIRDH